MKKIVICFLIVLSIIITGCENNPENVKLKNKDEIIKYAKSNFGKVKYVKDEINDNSITYTLKDSEYNFLYTCESYASSFGIDGDSFGYYEKTKCDFEDKYRSLINTNLYKEGIMASNCSDSYCLFDSISFYDASKVAKIIKKIDRRKYFKDYYIKTYNGLSLGKYYIYSGKYIQEN